MNEPKIRFRGFDGEWKEDSWGHVSKSFKYGINAAAAPFDGKNKYLRITDIDENTREFLLTELSSPDTNLDCCDDYVMQDGDIVIARTGASVGKSYIYHFTDGKVYFAGFLIRMRVNETVDKNFVFQNTLTRSYAKYIATVSQRSGQPGVNVDELKKYYFYVPSDLEEQSVIGKYFSTLDELISSASSRLGALKQVKEASLQAMFPQEGETVPKIRFKGFDGDWKKVRLEDIAIINPKCELPDSFEYVDLESVVGTIMTSHRREIKASAPSRAQRLAEKGDIFYQTVRPYQKNNYHYQMDNKDFVFSTGYAQIRALKDGLFLFTVIQSNQFMKQVMDNCTGTSFPAINPSSLRKLWVYDCDMQEQQVIGKYFSALDRKIELQSQRLEKLKQIKAACLDKMFV